MFQLLANTQWQRNIIFLNVDRISLHVTWGPGPPNIVDNQFSILSNDPNMWDCIEVDLMEGVWVTKQCHIKCGNYLGFSSSSFTQHNLPSLAIYCLCKNPIIPLPAIKINGELAWFLQYATKYCQSCHRTEPLRSLPVHWLAKILKSTCLNACPSS